MSPEEFTLGAEIDEVTNVFNMGATAFCLLGGERDRSLAKWEAGEPLYEVAAKATAADRNSRYSSLAEFYEAWARALKA
jgi:serine/threonine-protein kinase